MKKFLVKLGWLILYYITVPPALVGAFLIDLNIKFDNKRRV